MTFERRMLAYMRHEALFSAGDRVLIACSGGVDSTALLHFLAMHQQELQIEVAAAHVDHQLRGDQSVAEGYFVRELCDHYNIPFFSGTIPVPTLLKKQGGNVQAVCREGRYAFLEQVMQKEKFQKLATAHHAEDQLETMLMQIMKGVPPKGMFNRRSLQFGQLVRPFLVAMKAELCAYLKDNGWTYREDPSNASDAYLRNRLRHQVVPLLLQENRATARNAVRLASNIQRDEQFLHTIAQGEVQKMITFTEEGFPSFLVDDFVRMPVALQTRTIPLLLNYLYDGNSSPINYHYTLLEQLHEQMQTSHGQVSISLPNGYQFIREYTHCRFGRQEHPCDLSVKVLPKGVWTQWGEVSLYWNECDDEGSSFQSIDQVAVRFFDLPDTALPLYVRTRQQGDRILLSGMSQPKRLTRLMIDEKIGMEARKRLPVVVTAMGEVCAVPGVRFGAIFSSQKANHKYIFKVRFT